MLVGMTGVQTSDQATTGYRAGSPANMGTGVPNPNTPEPCPECPDPGTLQIDSKLKITPGPNSIQVKGRVRIKLPSDDAPVADFRFDWDFDT